MDVWIYSLVSVFLVSLVSFIGLSIFLIKKSALKEILLFMISFSAGALFGNAFIHLLPETVEKYGFGIDISIYLLSGIVASFIIEKIVQWRHCHIHSENHVHPFAIMNLFGDAVHNFIDGILIGTSYLVDTTVGVATTLAVIFHEIPQEIGDFAVMLHGGFSRLKALLYNFLIALTAVLGTVLALVIGSRVEGITAFLIPFAAGNFIYIAGSDLIPELHKDRRISKSLIQLFTFILGILVMCALLLLE